MILYWRRYGKAGGCQIIKKITFKKTSKSLKGLHKRLTGDEIAEKIKDFCYLMTGQTVTQSKNLCLFFENCILKYLINISMFRHPRCGNESYQTKKQTEANESL